MDLRERRELNNGFGNGLSRAFEIAVTPLVFGAMGFGLDGVFGIRPVLTIVFVVLALIGMFIKLWYGYDAEMKVKEAEGAWNRNRVTP